MGFFDILGKAADKLNDFYDKQNERLERYERQMEYKSDSTLKAIAKNESRPYFERIAASRVYKKRHQDDD